MGRCYFLFPDSDVPGMSAGFNRIAGIYDPLARFVFGSSLIQSQLYFLPQLKDCKNILVLGGGTGRSLKDLRIINSNAKIVFIDASANMLKRARKNIGDDRIEFICGSVDEIPLSEKYDAVILYNFLDLFSNESLSYSLKQIKMTTDRNSLWLVADFVSINLWHRLLLRVMYLFFYFSTGLTTQTLPDWKEQLAKIGLRQVEGQTFYGGFIHCGVFK